MQELWYAIYLLRLVFLSDNGSQYIGEHTDPYYDFMASSTKQIPQCADNSVCTINMAYTEGSSWEAFFLVDNMYLGGLTPSKTPQPSFPVQFACQTAVTGLFQSQLADGILGLSRALSSLQFQMVAQKAASSPIFGLCFKIGGGVITMGGIDQRLNEGHPIQYTPLIPTNNDWYCIKLLDIVLLGKGVGADQTRSIGVPAGTFEGEHAALIDSGTTDSYFPSALLPIFEEHFLALTGIKYSTEDMVLTEQQLNSVPDMRFVLEDVSGNSFSVTMMTTSFIEDVGDGKFAFRLYFTEKFGAIFGASFMNGNDLLTKDA